MIKPFLHGQFLVAMDKSMNRSDCMRKNIMFPILAYIGVLIVVAIGPVSDEAYNQIGWKLFVGQAYAIPVCIIVALICYFLYRKKSYM